MRRALVFAVVAVSFAASLGARWWIVRADAGALAPARASLAAGESNRIVSMAPSLTETAFALGLGDRVVGVTRYCTYPPEVQEIPSIGGFLDPNYEAIVALQPDRVLLLTVHGEIKQRLETYGLATLVAEHRTLDGILASFDSIARRCSVPDAGERLLSQTKAGFDRVSGAVSGLPKPTVLLCNVRNVGTSTPAPVHITGKGQWYDNLLQLAGGRNAYTGGDAFPELSAEAILRMDPEVIVDMVPDLDENQVSRAEAAADWDALASVRAVRNGRVHVLTGSYLSIPGPRLTQTLEDMARAIHPEADWGDVE